MMLNICHIFFILIIISVLNRIYCADQDNTDTILIVNKLNETVNPTEYCKRKICVLKCCRENEIHVKRKCEVKEAIVRSYTELEKKNFVNSTDMKNLNIYTLQRNVLNPINTEEDIPETLYLMDYNLNKYYNFEEESYVLKDGSLAFYKGPNYWNQWDTLEPYQYCVDFDLHQHTVQVKYLLIMPKTYDENDLMSTRQRLYSATGMLISSLFMMTMVFVYLVLPELRTTGGLVMTMNVLTLTSSFIVISLDSLLNILKRELYSHNVCIAVSILRYYSYLSSFVWMTVLSFDIWRTISTRMDLSGKKINHRRFAAYCLFGWGIPFLLTIFVEIMDYVNLEQYPWIIKPHFHEKGTCFFGDSNILGYEKALYLYTPMTICLLCNVIFYISTGYTINKVKNNFTTMDNVKNYRARKARFGLYLKLSVLSGFIWILDIVEYYLSEELYVLKFIFDTCNLLTGVIIFFIFVFKKNILKKLRQRFKTSRLFQSKTDTTSSSATYSRELTEKQFIPKKYENKSDFIE